MFGFVFILIAPISLIASVELFKKRFDIPGFISRKIIHFGAATISLFAPLFVTPIQFFVICIFLSLLLLLSKFENLTPSLHDINRRSFGEVTFGISVAIVALLFLPENLAVYQYGILILGVSDGLAGLIGEGIGKRPFLVFGYRKTIEGTAVFFITALVLTTIYFSSQTHILALIFFAMFLTSTELISNEGLDNLFLPILAASLMFLFGL